VGATNVINLAKYHRLVLCPGVRADDVRGAAWTYGSGEGLAYPTRWVGC
jgi:hypothetical protein